MGRAKIESEPPSIRKLSKNWTRLCNTDIRCDRQSVLGNPFHMGAESQRDRVCAAHREFLIYVVSYGRFPDIGKIASKHKVRLSDKWDIPTLEDFVAALLNLKHLHKFYKCLRLWCWCRDEEKPEIKSYKHGEACILKNCHCNSYRDYVMGRLPVLEVA